MQVQRAAPGGCGQCGQLWGQAAAQVGGGAGPGLGGARGMGQQDRWGGPRLCRLWCKQRVAGSCAGGLCRQRVQIKLCARLLLWAAFAGSCAGNLCKSLRTEHLQAAAEAVAQAAAQPRCRLLHRRLCRQLRAGLHRQLHRQLCGPHPSLCLLYPQHPLCLNAFQALPTVSTLCASTPGRPGPPPTPFVCQLPSEAWPHPNTLCVSTPF